MQVITISSKFLDGLPLTECLTNMLYILAPMSRDRDSYGPPRRDSMLSRRDDYPSPRDDHYNPKDRYFFSDLLHKNI